MTASDTAVVFRAFRVLLTPCMWLLASLANFMARSLYQGPGAHGRVY